MSLCPVELLLHSFCAFSSSRRHLATIYALALIRPFICSADLSRLFSFPNTLVGSDLDDNKARAKNLNLWDGVPTQSLCPRRWVMPIPMGQYPPTLCPSRSWEAFIRSLCSSGIVWQLAEMP